MTIIGVALLAFCVLIGKLIGYVLGALLGFDGDIGGVGFAMIFLMLSYRYVSRKKSFSSQSAEGMRFWKNMYIPIIVAMAASQNVNAAISGGFLALLAGLFATATCFLLVPLVARIGEKRNK